MIVWVSVAIALLLGVITVKANDEMRDLQSMPMAMLVPATPPTPAYTSTTKALKYYGDDIRITWAATLGCGACINGGYTYCVQGKEGDDFTGKTVTQTCCRDSTSANCPQVSNTTWTCSNIFSDRMTAKGLCPYKSTSCGSNLSISTHTMDRLTEITLI